MYCDSQIIKFIIIISRKWTNSLQYSFCVLICVNSRPFIDRVKSMRRLVYTRLDSSSITRDFTYNIEFKSSYCKQQVLWIKFEYFNVTPRNDSRSDNGAAYYNWDWLHVKWWFLRNEQTSVHVLIYIVITNYYYYYFGKFFFFYSPPKHSFSDYAQLLYVIILFIFLFPRGKHCFCAFLKLQQHLDRSLFSAKLYLKPSDCQQQQQQQTLYIINNNGSVVQYD